VPSFSGITPTTATASWGAAPGTVAYYQYSVNSGAWINVGTALAVTLTGLAPGTGYTVQVQAVNVTGAGAASTAGFTTLPALPGAPGVPSFSGITPTTATVSWAAASGTVAYYQYRVNSGAWTSVGAALAVNLSGLAPLTSYTVQLEAVNATGPGLASSASFTTLPVTENATVQSDEDKLADNLTEFGYSYLILGSISPVYLSNNVQTYTTFCDVHGPGLSSLQISGFTSDPGAAWLVSAEAHGVTNQGSAATYSYSGGTASWSWAGSSFGFPGSGAVAVQVVHK
jgi:hypothetical protein